MATPRNVTVCGITAEGTTVREARRIATERVTAFVRESAAGPILRLLPGGLTIAVWRAVEGWAYAVFDSADAPGPSGPSRHDGHDTARDAENRARLHAAQIASDRLPGRGLECLSTDDIEGERSLRRWLGWQDEFARARAAGMDDARAREAANRLAV